MGENRLNDAQIWLDYTIGKQTYAQLADKYNSSIKTIQGRIDRHQVKNASPEPRQVIVLMDTTYWGRNFGVMLFKDAITKENLLKYYLKNETNALYIQGINELENKGFQISAIVCDGRKGLIQSFSNRPVWLFTWYDYYQLKTPHTTNAIDGYFAD